jgi:serine/threonine protein kinase
MPLAPGFRLGPYEIVSAIGRGGMGEVYRATDTRLGRTVAIKVLASHLAGDAEVPARFEREGRTISSLGHPNICMLFDIGREMPASGDAVDYLVPGTRSKSSPHSSRRRTRAPKSSPIRVGRGVPKRRALNGSSPWTAVSHRSTAGSMRCRCQRVAKPSGIR